MITLRGLQFVVFLNLIEMRFLICNTPSLNVIAYNPSSNGWTQTICTLLQVHTLTGAESQTHTLWQVSHFITGKTWVYTEPPGPPVTKTQLIPCGGFKSPISSTGSEQTEHNKSVFTTTPLSKKTLLHFQYKNRGPFLSYQKTSPPKTKQKCN